MDLMDLTRQHSQNQNMWHLDITGPPGEDVCGWNLIDEMDKDEKIGSRLEKKQTKKKQKNKEARLMFKCCRSLSLSVWKLWVCVLRQNQFQFASTSRCGVNNGGLVANMHSMDGPPITMTRWQCATKLTVPRIIFCVSRWNWSGQVEWASTKIKQPLLERRFFFFFLFF